MKSVDPVDVGGSQVYAKKAKEYRDLVSSFQVELMKNKDVLAPALKELCEQQNSCLLLQ